MSAVVARRTLLLRTFSCDCAHCGQPGVAPVYLGKWLSDLAPGQVPDELPDRAVAVLHCRACGEVTRYVDMFFTKEVSRV